MYRSLASTVELDVSSKTPLRSLRRSPCSSFLSVLSNWTDIWRKTRSNLFTNHLLILVVVFTFSPLPYPCKIFALFCSMVRDCDLKFVPTATFSCWESTLVFFRNNTNEMNRDFNWLMWTLNVVCEVWCTTHFKTLYGHCFNTCLFLKYCCSWNLVVSAEYQMPFFPPWQLFM